jgi:hypothetical protein
VSLLFDQYISFRIISKIASNFPTAKQVRQLGIEKISDMKYGSMQNKISLQSLHLMRIFLIYPISKDILQK